jgi:hypothetical protein
MYPPAGKDQDMVVGVQDMGVEVEEPDPPYWLQPLHAVWLDLPELRKQLSQGPLEHQLEPSASAHAAAELKHVQLNIKIPEQYCTTNSILNRSLYLRHPAPIHYETICHLGESELLTDLAGDLQVSDGDVVSQFGQQLDLKQLEGMCSGSSL